MRNLLLPAVATLLLMSWRSRPVRADVGQCWVLFVYNSVPKATLTARHQKELGERLQNAHAGSSESDGHTIFICEIDTNGDGKKGVRYRIRETSAYLGHQVKGFRLTASSYKNLRLAVREVELAARENSSAGLKPGVRKKLLASPLYRTPSAKK